MSRLGGTALAPEVVEAMAAASRSFVPLVELQASASATIAEATGAEAGCVASGAAACLFLASAACLARLDPAVMDRLPDTAGYPTRSPSIARTGTHTTTRCGPPAAKFVEFGYLGPANPGTRRWQMEAVISDADGRVFYTGRAYAGRAAAA